MSLRLPPRVRDLPDPSFEAVLWDFDGTLVDTEPIWIGEETALVTELGGRVPPGFGEDLVGGSIQKTARAIIDAAGRDDLDEEAVGALVVDRVVDALRCVPVPWRPGAKELLAEMTGAGVPVALVSASYRRLLDAVLDRLPAGTFLAVVSGDDVTRGKPDPEPYLRAAALLGVEPERCLVLEDSGPGAASGNAAGCRVLAVPSVVVPPPAPRRWHEDTLAGLDLAALRRLWGQDA